MVATTARRRSIGFCNADYDYSSQIVEGNHTKSGLNAIRVPVAVQLYLELTVILHYWANQPIQRQRAESIQICTEYAHQLGGRGVTCFLSSHAGAARSGLRPESIWPSKESGA